MISLAQRIVLFVVFSFVFVDDMLFDARLEELDLHKVFFLSWFFLQKNLVNFQESWKTNHSEIHDFDSDSDWE